MSGHNKWSTIKHKKARTDAARGKLFTKLIREITVSARVGGGDPDGNPRLRSAVIAARKASMPNDTIQRAIKRGSGDADGDDYEELTYEGYGPHGVAFFLECLTDNRNRTVAEVRHLFSKHGGNLGTDGSVAWMFEQRGYVEISKGEVDFDQLFEDAVEAGADDIEQADEHYGVYCEFASLNEVTTALEAKGYEIGASKPIRIPQNTIAVSGGAAASTLKLMDALDDQDDVQNVYMNAEIAEEEIEALTS